MVSIDPRTMAVRQGGGGVVGDVVRLVGFAVGLGVLVHGWQGLLAPGEDADSDGYICVEDGRGCGPIAVDVSDEDRFDDDQANAPADDALGEVAQEPADLDEAPPSGGLPTDRDDDAQEPRTLSCLVSDSHGACLNWDDLPPADRTLLENLYRRNGVQLP